MGSPLPLAPNSLIPDFILVRIGLVTTSPCACFLTFLLEGANRSILPLIWEKTMNLVKKIKAAIQRIN